MQNHVSRACVHWKRNRLMLFQYNLRKTSQAYSTSNVHTISPLNSITITDICFKIPKKDGFTYHKLYNLHWKRGLQSFFHWYAPWRNVDSMASLHSRVLAGCLLSWDKHRVRPYFSFHGMKLITTTN
jgi:hypothetical protein